MAGVMFNAHTTDFIDFELGEGGRQRAKRLVASSRFRIYNYGVVICSDRDACSFKIGA